MLDFNHVPGNINYIQRFEANSPTAGAGWYTWVKPRGIQFVHFTVIAGGSGGSSAVLGNNSTSAGGGGGGSGAYFSGIFPAISLPDILYISVGFGGLGGAAVTITGNGLAGLAGIASYISIAPNTTVNNLLCIVNGGGAPGVPVGAAPGVAGNGGALSTTGNMPLVSRGTYSGAASGGTTNVTFPGNIGTVGGTTAAASNLTLPTTGICLTGGTGGGAVGGSAALGAVGGQITGSGAFPTSLGGLATTTTTSNGNNGNNGFQPIFNLFYFYGGTGGSSGGGQGGNGGTGGNGAYGCGGGGGGGAITGFTSGAGGNGGPGLVIASCW